LADLAKQLKAKPEDWVKRFLALEGLSIIFEVLAGSSEQQSDEWARRARDLPKLKKEDGDDAAEGGDDKKDGADSGDKKDKKDGDAPADGEDKKKDAAEGDGKKDGDGKKGGEKDKPLVIAKVLPNDPFDLLQSECIKVIRTLMNTQVPYIAAF